MNYLILSAIVIGFSYLYERLKRRERLSKGLQWLFYLIICLSLCVFAGLRTRYNDTSSYVKDFLGTPDKFSALFKGEFSIAEVYLFKIWNYGIFHYITQDVNIYFFLCSIVFVFPAIHLINKYSKSFTVSVVLFMFAGMYLFSLAGLKQALATGIIMMAIPSLIKKRYWLFYLFALLAVGFHAYSIAYLVVPILGREVFNKRTVIFSMLVLLVGVSLSYFSGIISAIIELLGKDVGAETIESGSVNILRAVVFAVPLVLTIMSEKRLKQMSDEDKVFVKLGLLSSVFMLLALFGNPILFGRIPQYFLIGTVVSVPTLIEKAFVERERKVIFAIAVVCYVAFGIYGLYNDGAFAGDIFGLIWF